MTEIQHLILCIHPPVRYSQRRLLALAPEIGANCRRLMVAQAADETTAVCILQTPEPDEDLLRSAREAYGARCVVDPDDDSEATLALLARDAERCFRERGFHGEWNIYELWSSNNARRWCEGLKKTLAERGYSLATEELGLETFGTWSGCHHKYSNFFAAYLGARRPAHLHAETHLCTHKGMPMDVAEFVECVELDRHVLMYLFRREDGLPMAQFWDGLRPVWERPHTAAVALDPSTVDLINFSPNALLPVDGVARKLGDGLVADVGDACHPAYSTIVGRVHGQAAFEAFRWAMANAVIASRTPHPQVMYGVEV